MAMTMTMGHRDDRHCGVAYDSQSLFAPASWSQNMENIYQAPSTMIHQAKQQQQQQQQSMQTTARANTTFQPVSYNAASTAAVSPFSSADVINMSSNFLANRRAYTAMTPQTTSIQSPPTASYATNNMATSSYMSSANTSPVYQTSYTNSLGALMPSTSTTSASSSTSCLDPSRKYSTDSGVSLSGSSQTSYSDALDASRNIMAMSQQDMITPRPIYGHRTTHSNASASSYGFPTATNPTTSTYDPSSVDSYSDYGSVCSDILPPTTATTTTTFTMPSTLPLIDSLHQSTSSLPTPLSQSIMMGQFNSKLPQGSSKKHRCKICNKRFTRPSSLQTHMFSHTGEKPYVCEHAGCGRHFSVVSNLRRHRKVHRNGSGSGSVGGGGSGSRSPTGSWSSDM